MNKVFLLLFLLAACSGYNRYEKFRTKEILKQENDLQGRIRKQTFRRWISHPAHDRLATITEEYDTLGRVTREYGLNNPYYQYKYMSEKYYRDSKVHVWNTYQWPKGDSLDDFSDYLQHLEDQSIYSDGLQTSADTQIVLTYINRDSLQGRLGKTIRLSPYSWTTESLYFRIHRHDIRLDREGKLVLTSIPLTPEH